MTVSNVHNYVVRSRSVALLLVGIGLGYLAGISATPTSTARADVTEEPRREAFKAGSLVNEPILREIAATLVRIENRVERIEKHVGPQLPTKSAVTKPLPGGKQVPVNKNQGLQTLP
jgi:hypothetical protein